MTGKIDWYSKKEGLGFVVQIKVSLDFRFLELFEGVCVCVGHDEISLSVKQPKCQLFDLRTILRDFHVRKKLIS